MCLFSVYAGHPDWSTGCKTHAKYILHTPAALFLIQLGECQGLAQSYRGPADRNFIEPFPEPSMLYIFYTFIPAWIPVYSTI